MHFIFKWGSNYSPETVVIQGHSKHQELIESALKSLQFDQTIQVRNRQNERQQKISLDTVEAFTSMGHLSKVYTVDGSIYYYGSTLKQMAVFNQMGFSRINNTTVLNLNQVVNFKAGKNAKLSVFTQLGKEYVVSRHYAQQIKERLN
ncbi:LytTR family transcriptional regulator DNA-binding domain-containing protein [Latilactobacillus sp. 5-91]|uniref:LytTR family transcriptional regulator DNA-binding domain-containing protein n=1 Tax=Latilactobacillus sp. 5-91 TaxID=3410924 RepID=UPI003C7324C3